MALLCLGVVPALAKGELRTAYDFHAAQGLSPSFSAVGGAPLSDLGAPTASATHDFGGPAAVRDVRAVDAGERLRVPDSALPGGDWTVAAYVRVVPTSTTTLMDFGGSLLSVVNRRLVWDQGGRQVAGATDVGAGYREVTVQQQSGTARVLLDDVLQFTVPDAISGGGLVLFGDGPAELARLRTFAGVVDPAALDRLDVKPPRFDGPLFLFGYDDPETADEWLGPAGLLSSVVDDGTGPVALTRSVTDADANVAAVAPGPVPGEALSAGAIGPEFVLTGFDLSGVLGALADGRRYRFEVAARDRVNGAAGTASQTVRWDARPPTGLSAAFPTVTTDRTPTLEGAATQGPRDEGEVYGAVCKGTSCERESDAQDDVVGFFTAPIRGGAWSTDRLQTSDGETPVPVGELPLGRYHVEVSHWDRVGNEALVGRGLEVVAPGEDVPPEDTPSGPAAPESVAPRDSARQVEVADVPSEGAPVAPRRLSPRQLTRVLLSSAVRTLSNKSIRSFLRNGAAVPYTARSAGVAIVHVFGGTRPSRASLVASGQRVFRSPGTARIAVKLRKRARRILSRGTSTVVVRTVFVPAGGAPVARNRRLTLRG